MRILKSMKEIRGATVLGEQGEFKSAEIFPFIDHSDSSHQWAQNEFNVILKVIDLLEQVNKNKLKNWLRI